MRAYKRGQSVLEIACKSRNLLDQSDIENGNKRGGTEDK